jgi:antitoxin component of RelBE/YafQ-DinJ toxin-antitoxin module
MIDLTKVHQRKGVLVGAYVDKEIKNKLRRMAAAKRITVSDLLRQILEQAIKEGVQAK